MLIGVINVLHLFVFLVFGALFIRAVTEPNGLARTQFHWSDQTTDLIHRELIFVLSYWLPLTLIAAVVDAVTSINSDGYFSRTLVLIVIVTFASRLCFSLLKQIRIGGWSVLKENANRVRVFLLMVTLLTCAAVVYGQMFSVSVVARALINTLWLGLGVLIVHDTLIRWLAVTRRRLRLNELLAQRSAQSEDAPQIDESAANLVEISADTHQLVNVLTLVGTVIALIYLWGPLFPALDVFDQVHLWESTSTVDGETFYTSHYPRHTGFRGAFWQCLHCF